MAFQQKKTIEQKNRNQLSGQHLLHPRKIAFFLDRFLEHSDKSTIFKKYSFLKIK